MNTHAAFQGSYADMKLVRSRKVAQIIIEIPVEYAAAFIAAFGIPDPSAEIPVAIARLQEPSEKPQEAKERKRLSELRPSAQAALTCQQPKFWAYLRSCNNMSMSELEGPPGSEASAAEFVRAYCNIASRSLLDTDEEATERWRELRDGYQAWKVVA